MTIYGARYQNKKLELMKKMLSNYNKLINPPEEFVYPNDFPSCFHNKALSNALKSVFFSFKNNRSVILCGAEGCGKTQVTLWISEWYAKQKSRNDHLSKEFSCVCTGETKCSDLIGNRKMPGDDQFFFICTGGTECSDLIGHHKISEEIQVGSALTRWEEGFLMKAIIHGSCAVLDSLEEAPATVTERLNGLLDQKYDGKEAVFDVPENPANRQVTIHPDFRLLCTCSIDQIERISPSFLNRFDIIVFEDQLEETDEQGKKEIVTLLMEKHISPKYLLKTNNYFNNESHLDDDSDDADFQFLSGICFEENESDDVEYQLPPDLVESVEKVIGESNIGFLAKLCKAVTIYSQLMTSEKSIKSEEIVDFSLKILGDDLNFAVPEDIQSFLLSLLSEMPSNDENDFFYDVSPQLKIFMTKLMACSLINQPVCVDAPTGAGKTSAARAFSLIRKCFVVSQPQFLMHSFHSGTIPHEFYGTTTFNDKRIVTHDGTLTKAMECGYAFIADEMNLSTAECMKSLAPALEPNTGRIYLPGIEKAIVPHCDFFFIACQNELGTLGRNAIPSSISSRFRYFDYPNPDPDDIASICVSILKSKYQKGEVCTTTDDEARCIGYYMHKLNQMQQRIIPPWSLRDIRACY